jgi:hypothetical protein
MPTSSHGSHSDQDRDSDKCRTITAFGSRCEECDEEYASRGVAMLTTILQTHYHELSGHPVEIPNVVSQSE